MKVALDWQVSSYFGWGVYGLNLALEWSKDPSIEASAHIRSFEDIYLDRLRKHALVPFVKRSIAPVPDDAILIHGLGNDLAGFRSRPSKVAAIFFEEPLTSATIERAKTYDVIVAGSTWNANVLKGYGLTNVATIFQGVDRSLFHPAPKRELYPGKFLIFSGGKAEPRKGQDIVVKAFRIFAERHDDAILVTAWHSPFRGMIEKGMDLDLSAFADRVIDVGAVPNGLMAPIYRECDVAVFPNRAEGGTNLVAMECLACGVPSMISACTGHDDLLGVPGVLPLSDWQPRPDLWSEWGECSVEEIVEALETAYRNRCEVTEGVWSDPLGSQFQWSHTARALADIIERISPTALAA